MPSSETKGARKPSKQLTDLDVEEVSLVDLPANEEPFAVVKRQEEGGETMGTKTNEEAAAPPAVKTEKAADVHAALTQEKLAAITKLAGELAGTADAKELREKICQMQDIAWSIGPTAEVVQILSKSVKAAVAKAEAGDYGYPEGEGNGPEELKKALEEIVKVCQSMLEKLQKAAQGGKDDKTYPQPGKAPETKTEPEKAMPGKDDEKGKGAACKSMSLSVSDKGEVKVENEDKELLKRAVPKILEVAKGTDATVFAEVLKGLGFVPAPKEEPKPDETVAKLTAEITELKKRLGDIETARPSGNAAQPDGTATVVAKKQGFWDGAL